MKLTLPNSWAQWLHAIIAAFIGGASGAAYAALIAPDTFNFSHAGIIKLSQMALLAGIVPVLAYLKQFPTPQSTITVTESKSVTISKE